MHATASRAIARRHRRSRSIRGANRRCACAVTCSDALEGASGVRSVAGDDLCVRARVCSCASVCARVWAFACVSGCFRVDACSRASVCASVHECVISARVRLHSAAVNARAHLLPFITLSALNRRMLVGIPSFCHCPAVQPS
eukprot:4134786-Pleurochrysis_carterae.AAC.1